MGACGCGRRREGGIADEIYYACRVTCANMLKGMPGGRTYAMMSLDGMAPAMCVPPAALRRRLRAHREWEELFWFKRPAIVLMLYKAAYFCERAACTGHGLPCRAPGTSAELWSNAWLPPPSLPPLACADKHVTVTSVCHAAAPLRCIAAVAFTVAELLSDAWLHGSYVGPSLAAAHQLTV